MANPFVDSLLNGDKPRLSVDSTHNESLRRNDRRSFESLRRNDRRSSLVESLRSSSESGDDVTLTSDEAARVISMIESFDPFQFKKSVLSKDDIEALGMSVGTDRQIGVPSEYSDDGSDNHEGEHRHDNNSRLMRQPVFGTESALVAPDCTPDGDEPIPESVIHALKVINNEPDVEYQPKRQSAPVQRQPEQQPTPRVPQSPQEPQKHRVVSERPPQAVGESSLRSILKHVKESQRSRTTTSVRRKSDKPLTEEQRKQISKLL